MQRSLWCGAALLGLAACSDGEDFSDLRGLDPDSAEFRSRATPLGTFLYGEEVPGIAYSGTPPFLAARFAGIGGEAIDVRVRSGGDAELWLLDESFAPLGYNDDAGGNNPRIQTTLPADTPLRPYWIIIRDGGGGPRTIELALDGPPIEERYVRATGTAPPEQGLYSDGSKPAGNWVRCWDQYEHLGDCGNWVRVNSGCNTFLPADLAEERCELPIDQCSTRDGCTTQVWNNPTPFTPECFALQPSPGPTIDLPPCYNQPVVTIETFRGWVPADPACCDRTPECAFGRIILRVKDPACAVPARNPLEDINQAWGMSYDRSALVVGKSYIGPAHTNRADLNHMNAFRNLVAMIEEDPIDDNEIFWGQLGYRMRTEMAPAIECKDGIVMNAYFQAPPRFHMGYELLGPIVLQGVLADSGTQITEEAGCATFAVNIGGIPAPRAAWGLCVLGGYDDYRIIRHTAHARLCCDSDEAQASVTGTNFPSHTVFLNHEELGGPVQGPTEELLRVDHPEWTPMSNVDYGLWLLSSTVRCRDLL